MSVREALVLAVGGHRGTAAADRLCDACVHLLSVDAAAISLVFDGVNAGTLGASSARARVLDELQFTVGEGPCLESVSVQAPVLVTDLADDADARRWTAYSQAVLAEGIRAVFAMPVLVAGQYLGALDLFRDRPGVLDADDLAGALIAAQVAELPVLDLLSADYRAAIDAADGDVWAQLNAITRSEVSQATGVLVAQLDLRPAEALVRLRAHAYLTGRPVTAVARDILERRLVLEAD